MHISEGVLSAPVLITGAIVTAIGIGIGLKKTDEEQIPLVAVLSAAFFVASLIHVPIGPGNVHLVLNGICGLILGWSAFPAILVALLQQAILFQFGGLTTLGVNTFNMAFPGIMCFYLLYWMIKRDEQWMRIVASFLCGALSVFLSGILVALSLVFTGESFTMQAKLLIIAHFPIMLIEGLITTFCVLFIKRVKPEILEVIHEKKS